LPFFIDLKQECHFCYRDSIIGCILKISCNFQKNKCTLFQHIRYNSPFNIFLCSSLKKFSDIAGFIVNNPDHKLLADLAIQDFCTDFSDDNNKLVI
jgi:hypothetical protein